MLNKIYVSAVDITKRIFQIPLSLFHGSALASGSVFSLRRFRVLIRKSIAASRDTRQYLIQVKIVRSKKKSSRKQR